MFDVSKLTLDEVGEEMDKCIDKLGRLQALYSAMQKQEHRRVEKLIQEWNGLQRQERLAKEQKEKETSIPPATTTASK